MQDKYFCIVKVNQNGKVTDITPDVTEDMDSCSGFVNEEDARTCLAFYLAGTSHYGGADVGDDPMGALKRGRVLFEQVIRDGHADFCGIKYSIQKRPLVHLRRLENVDDDMMECRIYDGSDFVSL